MKYYLNALKTLQQKYTPALKQKANVIGTGIGFKYIGGKRTDEVCLVVLVEEKVGVETLSIEDCIPPDIEGVRTDVQVRKAEAMLDRKEKHRPCPGGCSIGHYLVTAGTLGCLLWYGDKRVILSNNHVISNSEECQANDIIVQQGIYDGGTVKDDIIATLYNRIPLFIDKDNVADAAVCLPNPEDVLSDIVDIGEPTGIREAQLGDRVIKSGRTTSITKGIVSGINVGIDVSGYHGNILHFINQIIVDADEGQRIVQGGDSGSAVLNEDNEIVGLLFAGETAQGSFYVASPIASILEYMHLTFEQSDPLPDPDFLPPTFPPPPTCDFDIVKENEYGATNVSFIDKSTGHNLKYSWWLYGFAIDPYYDWIKTKDVIHFYAETGKRYSVLHNVRDYKGREGQIIKSFTLSNPPPPPEPPVEPTLSWWAKLYKWIKEQEGLLRKLFGL